MGRFVSTFDGEIKPHAWAKGGRKQAKKGMSLRAVQRLRSERDEIIIATGIRVAGGVQMRGSRATGPFVNGKNGLLQMAHRAELPHHLFHRRQIGRTSHGRVVLALLAK